MNFGFSLMDLSNGNGQEAKWACLFFVVSCFGVGLKTHQIANLTIFGGYPCFETNPSFQNPPENIGKDGCIQAGPQSARLNPLFCPSSMMIKVFTGFTTQIQGLRQKTWVCRVF